MGWQHTIDTHISRCTLPRQNRMKDMRGRNSGQRPPPIPSDNLMKCLPRTLQVPCSPWKAAVWLLIVWKCCTVLFCDPRSKNTFWLSSLKKWDRNIFDICHRARMNYLRVKISLLPKFLNIYIENCDAGTVQADGYGSEWRAILVTIFRESRPRPLLYARKKWIVIGRTLWKKNTLVTSKWRARSWKVFHYSIYIHI